MIEAAYQILEFLVVNDISALVERRDRSVDLKLYFPIVTMQETALARVIELAVRGFKPSICSYNYHGDHSVVSSTVGIIEMCSIASELLKERRTAG